VVEFPIRSRPPAEALIAQEAIKIVIKSFMFHSALAGTKISRWPLLLMELTKPAFFMSSTNLVLWLEGVRRVDEAALVAQARAHQLGVWPVSPLYLAEATWRRRDCAGLVLGYASLELAEIEMGIGRLAEVLSRMRPLAS
jgi:hypothetical protein